ncbi:MAG: hypothetical protein AAGB15_07550 [Pseudomonadota bacterium]
MTDALPRPIDQAPVPANRLARPGQSVELALVAQPRRGLPWGGILAFAVLVVGPLAAAAYYLETMAAERYASRASFSIRSAEQAPALEIFGAVTQLGGGSGLADSQILYDFIQSQQIVEEIRRPADLEARWSRASDDLIFALGEGQPIEEIHDHWARMIDISLDMTSGILDLEVRAFQADDAQAIARAVLDASGRLVNEISENARDDAVRFAAEERDAAEERLRAIRAELRTFKLRSGLRNFRNTDQTGAAQDTRAALGAMAALEEERARLEADLDALAGAGAGDADARRADVVAAKLAQLDQRIAKQQARLGGTEGDAAAPAQGAIAYEELLVDRAFAEEAYKLALATYDQASAEARRKQRHLAVHIQPTLSERADYPDKPMWLVTIGLAGFAAWAILMLVIGNIRERR